MRARLALAFATLLLLTACVRVSINSGATPLDGVWRLREYRLAAGDTQPLDGTIFFVDGKWSVLYFVLDERGAPQRGSGEGGAFTLDGDRLTFEHRFNLSGGGAAGSLEADPLSMTIHAETAMPTEACTIDLDGDRLIVFFPSGNSIVFARWERDG